MLCGLRVQDTGGEEGEPAGWSDCGVWPGMGTEALRCRVQSRPLGGVQTEARSPVSTPSPDPSQSGSPSVASLEDEGAVLPIEGKVCDGDGAGRAEDGRRQPVDAAVRGHEHIAVESHLEDAIDAVHKVEGSDPATSGQAYPVGIPSSSHAPDCSPHPSPASLSLITKLWKGATP